jgi:hypothetical protein
MLFGKRSLFAALLGMLLVVFAGCGGGTPGTASFDLAIADGGLVGDETTFTAKEGDTVTLDLSSDVHGTVHIHGYDHQQSVGPGEPSAIEFVADATGRFSIEFHSTVSDDGHDDHSHDEPLDFNLGALEIRPR